MIDQSKESNDLQPPTPNRRPPLWRVIDKAWVSLVRQTTPCAKVSLLRPLDQQMLRHPRAPFGLEHQVSILGPSRPPRGHSP
jgi:hypothetical protein